MYDEDDEVDDLNEDNIYDLNYLAEYGVDSAMISDQRWEDILAVRSIKAANPEYPHILKVINYTPSGLQEQEEWLRENCREAWKRIGWNSSCSYTVAIGFASHVDAILYRLRWH